LGIGISDFGFGSWNLEIWNLPESEQVGKGGSVLDSGKSQFPNSKFQIPNSKF
jgi:hypothetical protein